MKKTLFLLLLLTGLSFTVKAQVTDVYAGNDTIELRVGNYQYGFIQWQIAYDTENWRDIEGANESSYRFFPTENAYYRARATFPNCPEGTSSICYVQVPPKADAGPDRTLPEGSGAAMFALLEDGCVGEWEIISGENGTLSDMHSPNAYFEGTDSEYKLKWTVTNAAGSVSDTLCIKYLHTVMSDNYLVVDTTDIILSDSTLLVNGEYIIAFSEPVELNDSMLLIGVGDNSFLRKVVSYTYDEVNDVYDIFTIQGTLADLLEEGVFSFDLTSSFKSGKRVVVSNRYPTRKDIAEIGWDGVYVMLPKENSDGVKWNLDKDKPKLTWTPGNLKLPGDMAIVPTFEMEDPNFMCEMVNEGFHVNSFKFGLYNTAYTASMQFYFPGKTSFTFKQKLPLFGPVDVGLSFYIGAVQITPQLNADVNISTTYSLGPEMTYIVLERGFICNYIMYDEFEGWRFNSGRIDRHYDFDSQWPEYGDLTCKVSLGVKLSMLLYKCIGPYAGFSLSFEGTHNTFGAGFTAEQFKVKEQYELGVKAKVLSYDILDFNWPFVTFDMLDYQDPYSIQMVDGNNQSYSPGHQLTKPLSVLVKKKNGKPSKGVRVKFETTDGTFSSDGVFTNDNGVAWTRWTPGSTSDGNIQAKAYSYNVKNEAVQGAPVIFNATRQSGGGSGTPDCSTLSVTAYLNGNGQLLPRASGGRTPYLFSKDGTSYGTSVAVIPVQGQTYHFFVKDANQCIADCYYTQPTQDCSSSDLYLRLSHQGSTVTAHVSGGRPPYQYCLDDGNYGSASVFANLADGEHIVNVRDANGCVDVATINLEAYGGGTSGSGTGNTGSVTVTTSPQVNVVDPNSASGGGSITITGNATVSSKGICWSRHHEPTTSDFYRYSSMSGNTFSGCLMTDLETNVMYYMRAFAVTNKGTVYGNEVGFSTSAVPPVVTCGGVGNITPTTANALGYVSNVNGTPVTERGFCWSTNHNPTINGNHVECGFGTGSYSKEITGLQSETRYYLRAYAVNSEGTSYSDEVWFKTHESEPLPITVIASPVYGGNVSGGGAYKEGTECTITATANDGYAFVCWTDEGTIVSTDDIYSFIVTSSRDLVANFAVSSGSAPLGAINGLFSIAPGYQIYFSQGNLQYIGHAETPYWKFADCQWDYFGDNGQGSASPYVDRDLFGWGTSGYDHGAESYQPWSTSQYAGEYYAYGSSTSHLYDQTGQADWGYNAILNGGNTINTWRTLSNSEWSFLFATRNTSSGIRFAFAKVNGVNGVILLPDNWNSSYYALNNTNTLHEDCSFEDNIITITDWINSLEANGAVFLPAAGTRSGCTVVTEPYGSYWSSRCMIYNGEGVGTAEGVGIQPSAPVLSYAPPIMITNGFGRSYGFSVRLVHEGQGSAPIGYSPWNVFFLYVEDVATESACYNADAEEGSCPILAQGACWSTSPHPTLADNYAEGSFAWSEVSGCIQGLSPNTTYYLRAFVADSLLIYYSEDIVFTTLEEGDYTPQVDISEITNITSTSASVEFQVIDNGGLDIRESGVCYSTHPEPTIDDSFCDGNITGLMPNTTYYVRAWAKNIMSSAYSDELSFTTLSTGGDTHEYVDLGLPSGTLWATCNMGANAPEEYGDYFAWGETQPKDFYNWNTYQYCNGSSNTLTKYCNNPDYGYNGFTDDLTILLPEDDAATVNWGNEWSMPTYDEWVELYENTTIAWINQNGVNGRLFTAANGNSLFLPAAGFRWENGLYYTDSHGNYWSSLLDENGSCFPWSCYFDSEYCHVNGDVRFYGRTVRPVRSNSSPTGEVPEGAINGLFSVGEGQQVYFSQGNLQYQASTNMWRFAENQWDYVGGQTPLFGNPGGTVAGSDNQYISPTYDGWIDLFGWGTSGYNHGAVCYQPWSVETIDTNYFAYGEWGCDLYNKTGQADWGYNAIVNGGNLENKWHSLTEREWDFLLNARSTSSGIRYAKSRVNNVDGVVLLPDEWNASIFTFNDANTYSSSFNSNVISLSQWSILENAGAVFLPSAGIRFDVNSIQDVGSFGNYWSSSAWWTDSTVATFLSFSPTYLGTLGYSRSNGCSVRLVYGGHTDFPSGELPHVELLGCSDYTDTSALCQAIVMYAGGIDVTERGVCWSISGNPTIDDNHASNGFGVGEFEVSVTGLLPSTIYYMRAYAINGNGIGYSPLDSIMTPPWLPAVGTMGVSCISQNTATVRCFADDVTEFGICWSTSPNPTIDNQHSTDIAGFGEYGDCYVFLENLSSNTTYYVRAYGINDVGISYGDVLSFKTHEENIVVPEGALNGLFSIDDNTHQVWFSKGNLQYQPSTNTWRFAENQWDCVGEGNNNISPNYEGWLDLFGWSTSGINHGAVCYQPWSTSTNPSDYYAYGQWTRNLGDETGEADWGYNAISNGGNQTNQWHTPDLYNGWRYLFFGRRTVSGVCFAQAKVNNVNGVILFPDGWNITTYPINNANEELAPFESNIISSSVWNEVFESNGAVFLPTAGWRWQDESSLMGDLGYYWTSMAGGYESDAQAIAIGNGSISINIHSMTARCRGISVRLIQNYTPQK